MKKHGNLHWIVVEGELTWFQELRKPKCPLAFRVELDRLADEGTGPWLWLLEEATVSKQTSASFPPRSLPRQSKRLITLLAHSCFSLIRNIDLCPVTWARTNSKGANGQSLIFLTPEEAVVWGTVAEVEKYRWQGLEGKLRLKTMHQFLERVPFSVKTMELI